MTTATAPRTMTIPSLSARLESWARRAVLKSLTGLQDGQLTISDAWGSTQLGDHSEGLSATLTVNDPDSIAAS